MEFLPRVTIFLVTAAAPALTLRTNRTTVAAATAVILIRVFERQTKALQTSIVAWTNKKKKPLLKTRQSNRQHAESYYRIVIVIVVPSPSPFSHHLLRLSTDAASIHSTTATIVVYNNSYFEEHI